MSSEPGIQPEVQEPGLAPALANTQCVYTYTRNAGQFALITECDPPDEADCPPPGTTTTTNDTITIRFAGSARLDGLGNALKYKVNGVEVRSHNLDTHMGSSVYPNPPGWHYKVVLVDSNTVKILVNCRYAQP